MKLGAFSISLNGKSIEDSKSFYEKPGFSKFAGDASKNYMIMKNGDAIIGLFQGMFQANMLTFNPGWDQNAQNLGTFDDVRVIQNRLKAAGIEPVLEADGNSSGPASFMVSDPDGNLILLDQHV